jgi:hypothetical protein
VTTRIDSRRCAGFELPLKSCPVAQRKRPTPKRVSSVGSTPTGGTLGERSEHNRRWRTAVRMAPEIPPAAPRLVRHQQFVSATGRLAIVILREPSSPGSLLCDGEPLIAASPSPCSARVIPLETRNASPGDRLSDQQSGLTVICPRGGTGQLTFDGRPLLRGRLHHRHPDLSSNNQT